MTGMMGLNPAEFEPSSIGNAFMKQPMTMPMQHASKPNNWALMQALSRPNSNGGVLGVLPQLVGAYMLKKG